jgi:predicted peptidase
VANCYVANFGQTVRSFEVTVDDPDAVKGLKPEDFTIRNAAINFVYDVSKDTNVNSLSIDGNRIMLNVDEFLIYKSSGEGPLKGRPLTVECRTDKVNFSFKYADLEKKTEIIDAFAFDKFEGMEYYLYTPKDTTKARPLMVYLHGNAMAGIQLIFAKTTSHFASTEVQSGHQAYVLAPTSMLNKEGKHGWTTEEIDRVVRLIKKLINEGKVDPGRVYIQGNSMGGMGTINAILAYPELFAAAMPMCGTVRNDGDNRGVFESKAEAIIHLPIWIVQAKSDPVAKYEDSKYVYDYLLKIGADRLKATWFEDADLKSHGIYYTHAADNMITYMPEVAEWFFEQHR